MKLAYLNELADEAAAEELLRCCGSRRWVAAILERRPFADEATLFQAADEIWFALDEADHLEAFAHHPRIGEKQIRDRFASTEAWSKGEQSGVSAASEEVIQGLAEGNRAYDEKFGFVFLICATGKSASEMLQALQARLGNSREQELENAAREHSQITCLRLQKLGAA